MTQLEKREVYKNDFIQKAKELYGEKYTYEHVEYVNKKTKVAITCPIHGTFYREPMNFIYQHMGCKQCGIISRANKRRFTNDDFIKKSKELFGDVYTYDKLNYTGAQCFVTITCKKHGDFTQKAYSHLKGHGCPKCGNFNKHLHKLNRQDKLIEKYRLIHDNKYDYSQVEYKGNHVKIKIICPKHGAFYQIPLLHAKGAGCPTCAGSYGEQIIYTFLKNKGINFVYQKRFEDCRNKLSLPFDFYIPEVNMIIEYHGQQHYVFTPFFHVSQKAFKLARHRDWLKRKYCKDNHIDYVVIPYNCDTISKLTEVLYAKQIC